MKKVNFLNIFDFFVDEVNSNSFILKEIVGKFLLFIDGEQVSLPVLLFFDKTYDLKIIDLENGPDKVGLFRNLNKNDLLSVSEKKVYGESSFIGDSYEFVFSEKFICTTVFKETPLYYKFYVDEEISEDFELLDEFDNKITNFENYDNFIYFNPKQNYSYFYLNDGFKKPVFYTKANENKIFSHSFSNNEIIFKEPEYVSFFKLSSLKEFSNLRVLITDEADDVSVFNTLSDLNFNFFNKDSILPVFKKIKKISLFSNELIDTDLAKEKIIFYYTKETTHCFLDQENFSLKKKSINDVVFLAKEFLSHDFDFYFSKDLSLLDLSKKYIFDGTSFLEHSDGNISFSKEKNTLFFAAPFFEFEESKVFSKKAFLTVPDTIDYEYYSFNFKPIFVELVVKSEL